MSRINNNTYYEELNNKYYDHRNISIYRKWEREKRRKERGNYQYEQMLKRYSEECGECIIVNPAKEV